MGKAGKKKKMVGLAILAVVVLAMGLGTAYIVPRSFPPDEVHILYNNSGIKMPLVYKDVTELHTYTVKGKLYQVAVYLPGRVKPVVFIQSELLSYQKPLQPAYPVKDLKEATYHTYDPYLQGWKYEQNKLFIAQQYETWMGRPVAEKELYADMDILMQKVQRVDYEWRVQNRPEAIYYAIQQQRGSPLSIAEKAKVDAELGKGETREDILAQTQWAA